MSILQANNNLTAASRHLAEFANSDANVALVRWLDAAVEVYKEELVSVLPADLQALQAKVLQLEALRALAMGAVQTNGRI